MNVLNRLAFKNLKLNKKRTIGTIIGIILSVALICAVAGLGTSLKETLVQNAIDETGYYHLEVMDVTADRLTQMKNNRDISDVIETYHIGTAEYTYANDPDNNYFDVYSLDEEDFDALSYKLIDGRLPVNNNEIAVTEKLLINDNKKIGDTITLDVGHLPFFEHTIQKTETKTYKITGVIYKGISSEYYGITTNEKSDYINAYIILKEPKEYKDTLPHILGLNNYSEMEYYDSYITLKNPEEYEDTFAYIINRELLRWETFAFSDSTVTMLYTLIGMVMFIIVGTSVFCIRNSFAISYQEKRRMYGMLSSVGTTKKQLKQEVLKEGFVLGLIGIPAGIIFGVLAVFILVRLCNLIAGEFLFDTGIAFKISLLPVMAAVVLGVVTIYFSALGSAKRTSKISPIEALKSNDEIKITGRKLKTPGIIHAIFGTGGVIAYKNLKRSKRKYRITVISLIVSIMAFISMYSFINESFQNAGYYWEDLDYNVTINHVNELSDDEINKLEKVSGIKNKYLVYQVRATAIIENPEFDSAYKENRESADGVIMGPYEGEQVSIGVLALDDETFRSYCKKTGKSYDDLKDKGILFDDYNPWDENRTKLQRIYGYEKGDTINAVVDDSYRISVTIGELNIEKPYGLEHTHYTCGFIVVNKDYYNLKLNPYGIYIESSDAENTIRDLEAAYQGKDLIFSNMEDKVREDKAMLLLASIFLYGFIAVVTLIGVTNIFNTITSNIELRAKELAMLKSIGMTKKEFKRMVNLETVFYSAKSLFYGIILGVLGSVMVHKPYAEKFGSDFVIPYKAIIISIAAVLILVWAIMRYGMNKINRQNIIETIRKDNV